MIKHKINSLLIVCALSFNVIAQPEVQTPNNQDITATEQDQSEQQQSDSAPITAAEQAQIEQLTEFADFTLSNAFNSLRKIENILTEIAILVGQGSLKGDVPKVMRALTDNKITINALLQNQAAIVALKDPIKHLECAQLITEFCNAFIPYLKDQIATQFKNPQPFNVENFAQTMTRGSHQLNPEVLTRKLNETKVSLQSLQLSVKNIGLTWYNKAARKLDKYVVTPAHKWHVPSIMFYGGSIGLLSLYTFWNYGNTLEAEWAQNLIKQLYGANNENGPLYNDANGQQRQKKSTPPTTPNEKKTVGDYLLGQPDQNHDNIVFKAGKFATTDRMIKDHMLNMQPIGALAGAYLFTALYKTWQEDVQPVIIKNRDFAWNFLRGGEYLKIKDPGLTLMKPTVTFKDMVGLDEVKEEFYQILQYIDNPEQLMRIKATPEKGWLLTGETRTGKSFSVECLCGEIESMLQKQGRGGSIKFFNITANLINKFGIKDILEEVKEAAPAVLFIDEIDLLGLQRAGNNALLSEFLTAMQSSMNADPSKVVIVIAATNNPENIDKALRQNGRFGKEIRFEYPAKKYRLQYILRELNTMALDISQFDIETLANKTNKKSFEDLHRVINHAMKRAWFNGTSLTQELLETSIDTEVHHIIMTGRKDLPESEIRIIATHFAGRALAAIHLPTHEQLDKVTVHARMTDIREEGIWENYAKKDEKDIQQKIEYGYLIFRQPNDSINLKQEQTIINEAIVLIAGFAAEELLLGSHGFTCHSNNHDIAFKLIESLVFGGLKQESLPKTVREELKLKAYKLLQQCHVDAMELLKNHKDALVALTDELIKKQIMTDKEIQAVINKAEGKTTELTQSAEVLA